jgi:hypothetical protein
MDNKELKGPAQFDSLNMGRGRKVITRSPSHDAAPQIAGSDRPFGIQSRTDVTLMSYSAPRSGHSQVQSDQRLKVRISMRRTSIAVHENVSATLQAAQRSLPPTRRKRSQRPIGRKM